MSGKCNCGMEARAIAEGKVGAMHYPDCAALDGQHGDDLRTFVRVYRLPEKLTNGFCNAGGKPITFLNVDWFEVPISEGREPLTAWIKRKVYYNPAAAFLVIGDHPDFVYRIEPLVILGIDPGKPGTDRTVYR